MKVTDGNITKGSIEEAIRAWTGKDRQDEERNDERKRKEHKGTGDTHLFCRRVLQPSVGQAGMQRMRTKNKPQQHPMPLGGKTSRCEAKDKGSLSHAKDCTPIATSPLHVTPGDRPTRGSPGGGHPVEPAKPAPARVAKTCLPGRADLKLTIG